MLSLWTIWTFVSEIEFIFLRIFSILFSARDCSTPIDNNGVSMPGVPNDRSLFLPIHWKNDCFFDDSLFQLFTCRSYCYCLSRSKSNRYESCYLLLVTR